MELTEREYLSIYNRAYHGHMPARGGWKNRDAAFSRLMKAALFRRHEDRMKVPFPHRHRTERHAAVNRDGESVIIETRY